MANRSGSRSRSPHREPGEHTHLEEHFFNSAGVRLHFIASGHGTPVILLHGMMCKAADWSDRGITRSLNQAGYRAIALDQRGHGLSEKPHDTAAYGKEMALDIVRLLDHLQIKKAHLVGYSMGGNILVQLLALQPERFLSAILGGAAGRRNWTQADFEQCEKEASDLEQGSRASQIKRLNNGVPPSQEQIKELTMGDNDHKAMAALRRSNAQQVIHDKDLAPECVQHVPIYGIVGSDDPYHAKMQALQEEALPNLEIALLDGATHCSCMKDPRFTKALLDFLARPIESKW